jgi:hypothetical protein
VRGSPGETSPPRRFQAVAISLGFSGFAAALMIARAIGYGESWNDRSQNLTIMAAIAGFLAAYGTIMVLIRSRVQGRLTRAALAGGLFGTLYSASFGLSYVIQNRLIAGHFEPNPERPALSLMFSSLQTAGMFAISAPTYLLPWMLPALMLAAAVILPRLCARPPSPTPSGARCMVETSARLV